MSCPAEKVLKQLEKHRGKADVEELATLLEQIVAIKEMEAVPEPVDEDAVDALYEKAKVFVISSGKADFSSLRQELKTSYNDTVKVIEQLETEGIVSAVGKDGKRVVLNKEDGDNLNIEVNSSASRLNNEYANIFKEIAADFAVATVKVDNEVFFENVRRDIDRVVPGDYNTNDRVVRVVDDSLVNELKTWLKADEGLALIKERAEANGIDIIVKANPLVDDIDSVIDEKTASPEYKGYVAKYIEAKKEELQDKVGVVDSNHVLVHELVHASAYHFMNRAPKNRKEKDIQDRINWLFKEAKYQYSRSIEGRKGTMPYWQTNVHEFIAEAMSNPDVIKELDGMQISKMNRLATVLRALVDALVSIVSTKKNKDTVYYYVVDGLMAVMENGDGKERYVVAPSKATTNTTNAIMNDIMNCEG